MRRIGYLLIFFIVAFSVYTPYSFGHDSGSQEEIRQLKKMVLELQGQMNQMQENHDTEMRSLKNELKKLRKSGIPLSDSYAEEKSLREMAELEAAKVGQEEKAEEAVFKQGGLALQALNPEISLTGDIINTYAVDEKADRFDSNFRTLGIHFEGYLDPYTRFKAAVPVSTSSAAIGEAYFTRYGIIDDINLTLGKFRQQFGVVNRWHKHGLDQVDFPLSLRQIFGNGGLNQTGMSLDWAMPPIGDSSQELTVQITEADNSRLFSGNTPNLPCILAHYKNYRDLSKDTYMELGFSGLFGWNKDWDISSGGTTIVQEDYRHTSVFGLDFSLLWEPTDNMRYRNIEWRNEVYWLNKSVLAPDNSGGDTLNAWGAYSYIQSKISRTLDIGVRADYYKPDEKSYADVTGLSLAPHAYTDNSEQWQVAPYITWHQSPFVKFRLEYNHLDGDHLSEAEDRIMFQTIFAIGPHKHERY
ncbi:MAG: hypothetical protein GY858_00660 [Candidatus Omnitrophica bacterium]|nr:hypothetical protein [Candidatus Omnitrophota bacterium]